MADRQAPSLSASGSWRRPDVVGKRVWPAGDAELARRLPWLLVFRAAVATALLIITLVTEWRTLPLAKISPILYAVIVGNYVAVAGMGVFLRLRSPAAVIASAYLVSAFASALLVVQATGVIDSAFSFLYLLTILDAAIVGGRRLALAAGGAGAITYGSQLVLQAYGILPAGRPTREPEWAFAASGVINLSAFYLTAFLAGHLAELFSRARQEASQAAASLERAEVLHAAILDALPVGVLAVDRDLRVHAANPRARAILHLGDGGAASIPAELGSVLPPPGKAAEVRLPLGNEERVLGIIRSGPASLAPPTPGPAPSVGPAHEPLEIVVVEDRTELAQLEARLVAQQRLASLGELAAAIAHEIRNPLAAISGSLELLLSGDADVESAGPLRNIVLREIDRLDRLVEEFLQFARPAPIERTRVDLAALARELCAVLHADEARMGHPIIVSAPDRLEAEVDPERFRQVLWNLVRNAVEASPAQAPVELRLGVSDSGAGSGGGCDQGANAGAGAGAGAGAEAGAGADARARGGAEAGAEGGVGGSETGIGGSRAVVIEIRDHGPGLDPAVRKHLFEPFRTTKPTGTGLGLAIVHRIIEGHGGSVELADAAGGGTVARVILPLRA